MHWGVPPKNRAGDWEKAPTEVRFGHEARLQVCRLMSIKETLSESVQVPVWNPTGKEQFAKVPKSILRRRDITPSAKLVLAVMNMESLNRGGCLVSDQAIADRSGLSRTVVVEGRRKLVKVGLIQVDGGRVQQVQGYRFLHPSMQAATDAPPRELTTTRTPVRCAKCSRTCRGIGKTGMCRGCVAELELPRQVQAALDRLGAGATAQDIAAHLKLKPLAAKIERILRRKAAVA